MQPDVMLSTGPRGPETPADERSRLGSLYRHARVVVELLAPLYPSGFRLEGNALDTLVDLTLQSAGLGSSRAARVWCLLAVEQALRAHRRTDHRFPTLTAEPS